MAVRGAKVGSARVAGSTKRCIRFPGAAIRKERLRVASVGVNFGGRHDFGAWRAGSTKRCIRFPGAADHAGENRGSGVFLSHAA